LELEFQRPSPDRPRTLQLGVEGQSPIALQAIEPVSPTISQLGEFAGTYYSQELQALYQLFLHDGKLFLRLKNNPDAEVVPVLNDLFRVEGKNLPFRETRRDRSPGSFSVPVAFATCGLFAKELTETIRALHLRRPQG
jgi:hypothetical protein